MWNAGVWMAWYGQIDETRTSALKPTSYRHLLYGALGRAAWALKFDFDAQQVCVAYYKINE